MQTTLSTAQELIVDDLVSVTRECIHPDISRSGLARCLKRYGLSKLKQILPEQTEVKHDSKLTIKGFKDYEPGFVRVDIKYLPHMVDESIRTYLLVAINRATRWIYIRVVLR